MRWGVLGAGDVCEVKSAPAMQLVAQSSLVAVMRRNGAKAADYARRHGVPKWCDDADALINDPDVNAIYIATPPNAHAELTRKAAAAGKPVYVEKPMARTYGECLDMIRVCEQAGVPLYVAYYRRALPNFLKVRELIRSGAIGAVRMVNIQLIKAGKPESSHEHNWRVDPDIAGGGYFWDLAAHQLDFLDFLLGPIASAKGFSANQAGQYKAEDIVSGCFRFESGVLGTGSWCFTSDKASETDVTTIIGSKGQLSYPTFNGSSVLLETSSKGRQEFSFTMPRHIQQPLIELVVQDLLGTGTCPSSGTSGARTNWVMEQIASH